MDSMSAFAMGEMNREKEQMVFDWHKAARLIKERSAKNARAGLARDWEYTSGDILNDGNPCMDGYTFLASTWATPEIEIDGKTEDCFVMQSEQPKWNAETTWPQSALDVLNKN